MGIWEEIKAFFDEVRRFKLDALLVVFWFTFVFCMFGAIIFEGIK